MYGGKVLTQPEEAQRAQAFFEQDGYDVHVPTCRQDRLVVKYDATRDPPERHIGIIIKEAKRFNMFCHGVDEGRVYLTHDL